MTDGWYAVVEARVPLTEGDFILDCPLSTWADESVSNRLDVRPAETSRIDPKLEDLLKDRLEIIAADVIVMTQACDLEHRKVTDVVVCPHFALSTFRESIWKPNQEKRKQKTNSEVWQKHFKAMADGLLWNLCILNSCVMEGHGLEHRVVDFHRIYTVPRDFLERLLSKRAIPRLRLCPPYREHLSQAIARFFLRVGLPQELNRPSGP